MFLLFSLYKALLFLAILFHLLILTQLEENKVHLSH